MDEPDKEQVRDVIRMNRQKIQDMVDTYREEMAKGEDPENMLVVCSPLSWDFLITSLRMMGAPVYDGETQMTIEGLRWRLNPKLASGTNILCVKRDIDMTLDEWDMLFETMDDRELT